MPAALPPLADHAALVRAMGRAHRRLAEDLQKRAADPRVEPSLREAHAGDRARGRTGEPWETYRDAFCDQVAASWVLCTVFARTLEDRGYLPHRLAGPGAADRLAQFRSMFRFLGERDFLLHVFDAIALLPGGQEVFGQGHAPLWRLAPTSTTLGELLDELRATDGGALRFSFGRPAAEEHDGASTRYLGDLYQDLNEGVRKRYALLQTPEFVERFLLDNTLDPAIRERGIAVTVLDPACGSGHLLLGAYDRLFEARRRVEPGLPYEESARQVLGQVYGVDLNPYAAAVARFRLVLSYLDKAGIPKLDQVAKPLDVQVYVGDSLLAGLGELQGTFGDVLAKRGEEKAGFERGAFSFFDPEADKLLAKTRFDVVVANPPYITEKDAVKRELIRKHYKAASGKYALSAPFVERIFQLGNEGGYNGQITSNSFMKREFGKTLIEEVLPKVDLTAVLDTTWVHIPAHDTTTVILFGRARRPVGAVVRVVMGIRGDSSAPAESRVWSSMVTHHGDVGYVDEFISVVNIERSKLAQHPWILGGGGATDLKDLLEKRTHKRLGTVVESIGFGSFTGTDDVFVLPIGSGPSRWIESERIRLMITGDTVRDWSISQTDVALTPYGTNANPVDEDHNSRWFHYLWPYRSTVLNVAGFGGKTRRESGDVWWHWYRWVADRYRTPLSIAFAFVATHNHFVVDRGGKVFNRSAPIIKLTESATEEEHLTLLAYLNSSVACFWMKQVFYPKGNAVHDVDVDAGKPENSRYEFAATGLGRLPTPTKSFASLGRRLDALGTERLALGIRHMSRTRRPRLC